jgi:hypothetical protein
VTVLQNDRIDEVPALHATVRGKIDAFFMYHEAAATRTSHAGVPFPIHGIPNLSAFVLK